MKKALFISIIALLTCIRGFCLDTDALREPIVRPNVDTLKQWMYNQTIVIHKGFFFDSKAAIEPSKIANVVAQGGFVFQKPPPFANYATSVWTFDYPDEKSKEQQYTVTATYAWALTFTGINRTLDKMIITGP